jgi:photosystem II stability/assembly factor-like uncharacterized protein
MLDMTLAWLDTASRRRRMFLEGGYKASRYSWAILCMTGLLLSLCLPGCGPAPVGKLAPAKHWKVSRLDDPGRGMPEESYSDLDFVDADCGWVTDMFHGLLYTEDGGVTWSRKADECLRADFVDERVGWVVNPEPDRSLVGRTVDGGESWTWTDLGKQDAQHIGAVSDREAWVVANPLAYCEAVSEGKEGKPRPADALLHTTDGGESWERVCYPGDRRAGFKVVAAHFPSSREGWLAGGNPLAIFVTRDGGETFTTASLPSVSERTPGYVHFSSAQNDGWLALCEAFLLHSVDGGREWRMVCPAVEGKANTVHLFDVSFPTRESGWAVGGGGIALHTSDGGKTWTRVETGAEGILDCGLLGVAFADDEHGLIIGHGGDEPNDMAYNPGHRISFVLRYVP